MKELGFTSRWTNRGTMAASNFSMKSLVFSALLGSFGIAGVGSGSEGIDLNEHPLERILNGPSLGGLRNSSRPQTDQADSRGQAINDSGSFSVPTADSVESLQPPFKNRPT